MPRLAGRVQGVVVQMRTDSGFPAGRERRVISASGTGKRTQIEGETWSWYSISASASAVSNGMLQ